MMFALFPFLIFVLAVAGSLKPDIESKDLVYLVFGAWPDAIAHPIEKEIQAVLDQSGKRTITLGAVLTVFFASNGVDAVRLAITEQYREHDPRPFWKTRGLCVIFILLSAVLIAIAALMFVALPIYAELAGANLPAFMEGIASNGVWKTGIMMSLLTFGVFACHAWLPGVHRSDRTILPGVILTILLWTIAAKALAVYFSSIATYSITYAGLAGVMSTLVFLYLMSAILVFGAGFNDELMDSRVAKGVEAGSGSLQESAGVAGAPAAAVEKSQS